MTADGDGTGHRLFEGAALFGLLLAFGLPAMLLLRGTDPLLAATCGYGGIAIFTGGIAAKYQVITSTTRWIQLAKNTLLAAAVALVFYLLFLVLFFI